MRRATFAVLAVQHGSARYRPRSKRHPHHHHHQGPASGGSDTPGSAADSPRQHDADLAHAHAASPASTSPAHPAVSELSPPAAARPLGWGSPACADPPGTSGSGAAAASTTLPAPADSDAVPRAVSFRGPAAAAIEGDDGATSSPRGTFMLLRGSGRFSPSVYPSPSFGRKSMAREGAGGDAAGAGGSPAEPGRPAAGLGALQAAAQALGGSASGRRPALAASSPLSVASGGRRAPAAAAVGGALCSHAPRWSGSGSGASEDGVGIVRRELGDAGDGGDLGAEGLRRGGAPGLPEASSAERLQELMLHMKGGVAATPPAVEGAPARSVVAALQREDGQAAGPPRGSQGAGPPRAAQGAALPPPSHRREGSSAGGEGHPAGFGSVTALSSSSGTPLSPLSHRPSPNFIAAAAAQQHPSAASDGNPLRPLPPLPPPPGIAISTSQQHQQQLL